MAADLVDARVSRPLACVRFAVPALPGTLASRLCHRGRRPTLAGSEVGLEVKLDRLGKEARYRKKYERGKKVQARRSHIASTLASEIRPRQKARSDDERGHGAPETTVEGNVAPRRLAHKLAQGGQAQARFLSAVRTIESGRRL